MICRKALSEAGFIGLYDRNPGNGRQSARKKSRHDNAQGAA